MPARMRFSVWTGGIKSRSFDPALVSSTSGVQTSIVHSLISTNARSGYPKFKAWGQMDLRVGNKTRHIPLALVLFFSLGSHAWAWGDEGHKVICELAFRLAKPNTRAEMQRLSARSSGGGPCSKCQSVSGGPRLSREPSLIALSVREGRPGLLGHWFGKAGPRWYASAGRSSP